VNRLSVKSVVSRGSITPQGEISDIKDKGQSVFQLDLVGLAALTKIKDQGGQVSREKRKLKESAPHTM